MTPMQKQYKEMKEQYPDALLLFRMGDFYECFYEDAEVVAKVLGITLTGRGKDEGRVPMAGIPYHALPNYLPKLLKQGLKVALGEQMEEPQAGKLVERKIVKVFTPGTIIDEKSLDPDSNNYLASIYITKQGKVDLYGVTFIDISTGELQVFETESDYVVKDELNRISPSEIICTIGQYEQIKPLANVKPQQRDQTPFEEQRAVEAVKKQFGVQNLKGFGIDDKPSIICALGGLLAYIEDCQKTELAHIKSMSFYHFSDYMHLDTATVSNLEILYSNSGNHNFTLLSVLDECKSSMGKRKLRNLIIRPYTKIEPIQERLDAVESLINELMTNDNLRELLSNVYDIERILSRIGLATANARDLLSLARSLEQIDDIVAILQNKPVSKRIQHLVHQLAETSEVGEILNLINTAIHEDPPITITEGNIIKTGYNAQIDELRSLSKGSKQILASIQQREIKETGISSLKIGFNKVFGYYIEVTRTHASKVPNHYIRKQTLANAERYITDELKQLEDKILNAEEQLQQFEYQIFCDIRAEIAGKTQILLLVADILAELDVLSNFAYIARQYQYTKPQFTDRKNLLNIKMGRHPVIERTVNEFTPNDVELAEEENLVILTGPNMSGKSTYIRQIALIVHMAQIGCYVPADSMELSLVDRIFTRVGASDNLATGESTFMVEMNETANILNNATDKSLIILDEVGRGTSTYDGVAIAWAIVEYIHNALKARTLFATHYHELISLEDTLKHVVNYKVNVNEQNKQIVFTHHISKGSTDRSYGVHVANIAGIPKQVVERAEKILIGFESQNGNGDKHQAQTSATKVPKPKKIAPEQIGFLGSE